LKLEALKLNAMPVYNRDFKIGYLAIPHVPSDVLVNEEVAHHICCARANRQHQRYGPIFNLPE
jgi:hypothetical protein